MVIGFPLGVRPVIADHLKTTDKDTWGPGKRLGRREDDGNDNKADNHDKSKRHQQTDDVKDKPRAPYGSAGTWQGRRPPKDPVKLALFLEAKAKWEQERAEKRK